MMPKSDPEARSMTNANSNEAITWVKLFITLARESKNFEPKKPSPRLEAGYCPPVSLRQQGGR